MKKPELEDGEAIDERDEDYLDEQQKALDSSTLVRIEQLIAEYQDEMNNFEAIQLGTIVFVIFPKRFVFTKQKNYMLEHRNTRNECQATLRRYSFQTSDILD